MRLAAAVVVAAAALVLPAAQAAERKTASPVLGLDVAKGGLVRLAWFDPLTVTHSRAESGKNTDILGLSSSRKEMGLPPTNPNPPGFRN